MKGLSFHTMSSLLLSRTILLAQPLISPVALDNPGNLTILAPENVGNFPAIPSLNLYRDNTVHFEAFIPRL